MDDDVPGVRTLYALPNLPYRAIWNRNQAHLDRCSQCVKAFRCDDGAVLCPVGRDLERELSAAFIRQEDLARCN